MLVLDSKMEQPFDYNNYMRYAWWNYYQGQAYQAWVKHMESIPVYQPLYSDPIWSYTTQDKWNSFMISPSSKMNDFKELDQDYDKIMSSIHEKKVSKAAEKAAKKAEKKRERNRVRNQRKKEARREQKANLEENHCEQLKQLDMFGKRYKGKSFGQGWAREKKNN